MKLKFDKFALREGINRLLDDGVRICSKATLREYGAHDWAATKDALVQWQSLGLLRIIKSLDEARDDEIVVEMLDYIDQKSPWPNWPQKSQ
jgi:hypothetical protein